MKSKRLMQCCIAAMLVCVLVLGGLWAFRLWEADQLQLQMLTALDGSSNYDPQTIVLQDTSKAKAEELAERLGARLRITEDGSYAALYLPEGVTIRDVVAEDDNREILSQLSIDYQVQISEIEEEEEPGLRLPARPDYTVSDDAYSWQGYLDYLNMKNVWGSYTGSGVTVAVIDTGIDTDHPEFAGRISEYSYNATEDKIVKDYNMDWSLIEDEVGHGTAVTGVLAASMDGSGIVGVAPNVEIIVIKAECDENGKFKRGSDLVFGLYYAIERDVQVVNMSFGGLDNSVVPAIQLAYDSDIICVASAGNDGTAMPQYPAAHPLVIGVGALESNSWELASYSNYGDNVDIVAPGTTYTAAMGGGYETKSGTSLSAPQVAGAVALFMQTNPYATFDAVTEVLYASGYDLGDLGRDWYYGFGALDLNAFLLEERGTVTFEMLTDELENEEGLFIRNHAMQELPEPERLYAVFDGWYYDDMFTEEYNYYSDVFTGDLTLYAKWVNEDDGVPYTYVELPDGTIEIRSYTGHRRFITVPEKIEGKVVSSIGDFTFAGQTRLREVTLPSGLTNIGLSAFSGCSNLVTMQIPAKVTKIGESAFADNVRLHTVGFSGSKLTDIGAFAFSGCGSLEQIELPSSVKTVDGSAFYGTTAMQSIGVQSGNGYFASTDGVLFTKDGSKLVAYPAGRDGVYAIPGSCTTVGNYAFGFAKLSSIDLKSAKTIGKAAFAHSSLETLAIPGGVTSVGAEAFSGNAVLSEVTIGKGLTKIDQKVFKDCYALRSITIPAGIQSIEGEAFSGSGLQTVTFASGSKLETIGDFAFAYCALETLSIPDSVTIIGDAAFFANPLTSVTLSANSKLKTIGMEAFRYCYHLTAINLPGKLETIDELAFANTGLEVVTVPKSVSTLGNGAFAYCSDLTAVTVENGNSVYHDLGGVVYTLDNTLIHTYPAGKADTSYTLEAATTSVGSYAFAGTGNLDTVYLSEVLVDINEYGFDSSGIDYINIPDSMIRLGRYSFTNCLDLYSVSFNATSNLARIGFGIFVNCGLTSFTIPANVSTMGQYVFQDCDELTSVTFAANSKLESLSAYVFSDCQNLHSITFAPGSALTSVQAHGLEGMANLASIDFGDAKVTNIDNFAFRFCTSLSTVNLPETVTNVGRYAFYGCESLTELALPVAVEHIGSYAFLGTTDLQLYMAADQMPEYLDEDWDRGIAGYYVGVTDVESSGDYKYAKLTSGGIAILEYLGNDATVDLTKVNLGGSITAIGGKAFMDSAVTSVTLPGTLTEIQAQAFTYSKLTSVTIPANVTFIGREAFVGTPITSLTFSGSNVKTIEQRAFAETEQLKSVTIPKSVTTLGTGVFQDSGLTSVTFASGIQLTEIPQKAFMGTKLESVTLPDSVTKVNHNAFRDVSTLKSVTFGNASEIKLMSNAFYRTGLTSLNIPSNVTYIGEFCFVGLENLTSLTVDGSNPNYKSVDGLLLSKNGRKLIAAPAGRTGSLTVPTSVEEIGFGAFERSALTEVKFDANANILTFGCRAFFEAENLKQITVPASVVSIDYYAFAYCESLETVAFADGNNLKGIYEGAFCGDSSLTDITVPSTIVEISDFAFYGCEKLDRIPAEDTSALKGIYDYAFAYTGISGDFTTPENLIDIGNYAFMGIKAEAITVPDSKQKELVIGLGAFEDCNELTEITLPFIGASFEDMEISWFGYIFGAPAPGYNVDNIPGSLETAYIVEGISSIGQAAFYQCTAPQILKLPRGIRTLYPSAFGDSTIQYELLDPVVPADGIWRNGHVGEGITGTLVMDGDAIIDTYFDFMHFTYLEEVVLPEGITEIGSNMFFECASLTRVVIPSTVISIGDSAFSGCKSLEAITLPEALSTIGDAAFFECEQLYEVTNLSDLDLTFDSVWDFGYVTTRARILIDKNGNRHYRDGVKKSEIVYTDDGFVWLLEDGNYTLLRYEGDEKNVRLPDAINGQEYTVAAGLHGIDTLVIPGAVKEILAGMFVNSSIQHLIIEEGVESIGDYAFEGSSLKTISLPSSLRTIGHSAFKSCDRLKYLDIPDNVTFIGNYAFDMCTSLEEVIWPSDTKEIPDYAFDCCHDLKRIVIPEGVTSIGRAALYYCDNLSQITLPDSLTAIGDDAFKDCWALEEITIPQNVECIGNSAFKDCKALQKVILSEGLVKIGDYVFAGCGTWDNLIIPGSVEYIGEGAFPAAANLSAMPTNKKYQMVDGILYDMDEMIIMYATNQIPEHVVLLEGITEIPAYVFDQHPVIKSIEIPEGVTVIGASAFRGSTLESISLPDSLQEIEDKAFEQTALSYLEIPDSVTSLGMYVFGSCDMLYGVKLPTGLSRIQWGAFENSGLVSVEIPDSVTKIEGSAFSGCASLRYVYLPDALTEIEASAFWGCSNLMEITLPEYLAVIDEDAFFSCENMKCVFNNSPLTLSFGDNGNGRVAQYAQIIVDASGNQTYRDADAGFDYGTTEDGFCYMKEDGVYKLIGCSTIQESVTLPQKINGSSYVLWKFAGAKNVILPDGIEIIPEQAFEYSTLLQSIVIPQSVNKIEWRAFYDCDGLWAITIPDSVSEVETIAFYDNDSLESVVILNPDMELGSSLFSSCDNLRTVSLPEEMRAISYDMFGDCRNLEKIILPEGLLTIGGYAFKGCGLLEFQIPESVCSIGRQIIKDTPVANDPNNWHDQLLIVDGWLMDTTDEVVCLEDSSLFKDVGGELYDQNEWPSDWVYKGKLAIWDYESWIPPYAETLLVLNIHDDSEFLFSAVENSVLLKSIVLSNRIGAADLQKKSSLFSLVSGITIFVEAEEKDLRWNANFPGWNNGNKVIYGNNWIWVNFYDEDGTLLLSEPKRTSEVIRRPFADKEDEYYSYNLIGWDLDGDGSPDTVPATSAADINAVAVYEKTAKTYTVTFRDAETGEIYSQQTLAYGAEIEAPADPVKSGQIFQGWSGYAEGMTVTGDMEFTARWHSHSYSAEVLEPTCTEGGYTTYTCSCGDSYTGDETEALGHDFGEWQVTAAPTCTEPGEEMHSCSRCGHTETQEVPAAGHSYEDTLIAPTCTEQGYTTHTCANCGDSYVDTYVDALGHDFGSWYVTKEASEDAEGQEKRDCSRCGHSETRSIPKKDHVHSYEAAVTAPTCTEKGYTTYTCRCGDSYVADEIAALGHDMGAWVISKAPTCEKAGEEQRTCSRCDYAETRTANATGHDYEKTVTEPTCTEDGYTTYVCAVCGDTFTDNHRSALGHDFGEWYVTKEANEDAEGEEKRDCSRCDASETRSIPKKDHVHSYEAVVTAPTCTEVGYTTYTCDKCGHSYTADEVPALGHDFGSWYVTKEATEDAEGEEKRDCSRCDASETRAIPKLDHVHDYTSVVTAPTCTESGYTTYTCDCGSSYISDEVPALGHDMGAWNVLYHAYCTVDGQQIRTCSRCDYTETEAIPATGHDWEGTECTQCHETRENPFTDVPEEQWFANPVLWAVEKGITLGTSAEAFSPNNPCTRAQIVTFLWRANGSPEPESDENPFTDVAATDYFYKAVLWAVENRITMGMSATTFGPNAVCTRGQVATFLWRSAGEPEPENETQENPFTDVEETSYFYKPILWAVENGVTLGVGNGKFAPNTDCTRAQIVTFLYRALEEA